MVPSQTPMIMKPGIHIAAKKMHKNMATLRLLPQTAQVLIVRITTDTGSENRELKVVDALTFR